MTERPDGCLDEDTIVALALGNVDGRERATALRHVEQCGDCRSDVRDLVDLAANLLQVGPAVDPPPDFETSVLARTAAKPRRRLPVIAALVGAVFALATAFVVSGLVGRGHSVAEAAMVTPTGYDVGTVWHDAGDDGGWVLVVVPRWTLWEDSGPHRYRLEAGLHDGTTVDLGPVEFATDDGTFATSVAPGLGEIRSVAVTDETGRIWCRGEF